MALPRFILPTAPKGGGGTANKTAALLFLSLASTLLLNCSGFAPSCHSFLKRPSRAYASAALSTSLASSASSADLVVISPAGGIGEISSVEGARLGGKVRWFVVSAPTTSSGTTTTTATTATTGSVRLTGDTLEAIERAGGSIEVAGGNAGDLLSDDGSSLSGVATWCRGAGAVLCAYDGKQKATAGEEEEQELGMEEQMLRSAIRLAAREAVKAASPTASKVAILAAADEIDEGDDGGERKGGLLQGLFGGDQLSIPATLSLAMPGCNFILRHGELFGAPESSPESSPFVGGPRREPIIRDMYTTRSVRVDPTISVSGNVLAGGSKTNRLEIGAAAARLGLNQISLSNEEQPIGIDVSISSFSGTDAPSNDVWKAEFERALKALSSSDKGATLFNAEFASVPSISRLTEWIATKWAPAILRSYDIAGIRVGARPVYAVQTSDNTAEIIWQELVDFQSVTSGKMIILVEDSGLTASRGAGDSTTGFGSVSMKPLPGEDILVRRLADAASQAIEKGLAVKPTAPKKRVVKKVAAAEVPKPVTTTTTATNVTAAQTSSSSSSGPRGVGARRSSQRVRGKRRVSSSSSPPKED